MKKSFSKNLKTKLNKIREPVKSHQKVLEYSIAYGSDNVGGAKSLIHDKILSNDEYSRIFLRGVFLSCGSISDPKKDYHLELLLPNEEKCLELFNFVNDRGLSLKKSERKGRGKNSHKTVAFLYCKTHEQISDFLGYIGAIKESFDYINITINKEIRNNVNRAVNCETANIDKTTRAAEKHIQEIRYILELEEKLQKRILSEQLREVAKIRIENAEMSLLEIGESLKTPLSKSGVNHRLKRISEIANRHREDEN